MSKKRGVLISRWVKDTSRTWITPGGDPVWVCERCGGGRHVWGVESLPEPQPIQCPDCMAIMINKECLS